MTLAQYLVLHVLNLNTSQEGILPCILLHWLAEKDPVVKEGPGIPISQLELGLNVNV